jgi:hypothetical protein
MFDGKIPGAQFFPKNLIIISYIYLYNNIPVSKMVTRNKKILHYPQLDTVLMVEGFIKEHSGEFKKRALWENLPKKMMYQTYCLIYDYLLESGKIARDKEGKICWVWNPKLVQKYLKKKHLVVR